jgi:hypothetical protein
MSSTGSPSRPLTTEANPAPCLPLPADRQDDRRRSRTAGQGDGSGDRPRRQAVTRGDGRGDVGQIGGDRRQQPRSDAGPPRDGGERTCGQRQVAGAEPADRGLSRRLVDDFAKPPATDPLGPRDQRRPERRAADRECGNGGSRGGRRPIAAAEPHVSSVSLR